MNLFISPHSAPSGLGSVIRAQLRHLPRYGWTIVEREIDADLVCIHAGAWIKTNKPVVQVCHGYYWAKYGWPREYLVYNKEIVDVTRRASHVIAPSEWVAQVIRRDFRQVVTVIPHGIELSDFQVTAPCDYVLWGKPRVDSVCDPTPVNLLAELATDVQFVSTFGKKARNVCVTGALEFSAFQALLSQAMVWLATARETGDIASREAMAYGVPVLGWRHGATAELVAHKVNGYLAEPDDYDDLLRGLRYCIANRDRLSAAARETATTYDWFSVMGNYDRVFRSVIEEEDYPIEVSVVVPCYNYARYLPECLDSVLAQHNAPPFEIIVVDDGSTDDTQAVLARYADKVRVITQPNRGLPAALNVGHRVARGRYIVNLDADNVLYKSALSVLYHEMQRDASIDIGAGWYTLFGQSKQIGNANIDPRAQIEHRNQIPSTCMMRSRSIKRLGGYRERQVKNEDAEFWCRALSAGLRAKTITNESVFAYRYHGQNKSIREEREDDGVLAWNYYYPWFEDDISPPAGFASQFGEPVKVHDYHDPHIAVIIPCGPGHQRFLPDALDSVYGQTFRQFECIVANDTGEPLDVAAMGHPWVRVIDTGRSGPGIARNKAISVSRAPLIVPLDADDMLYVDTLNVFYRAWRANRDCLIYSDCDVEVQPGRRMHYHSTEFSLERVKREALYQCVTMFARSWWQSVGGYEDGPFEDWLFGVKMHLSGVGGCYVPNFKWGVYRHWTTLDAGMSKNQQDNAERGKPEFKLKISEVYKLIAKWEDEMGCRGCGQKARGTTFKQQNVTTGEPIQVICVSNTEGHRSINSRVRPGFKYRYKGGEILTLLPGDEWIAQHSEFEIYKPRESVRVPFVPLPTQNEEMSVVKNVVLDDEKAQTSTEHEPMQIEIVTSTKRKRKVVL